MGWPLAWSLGLHALVLGLWSGALPLETASSAPAEPLQASLRVRSETVTVATAPVAAPVRHRPQPQRVLRPELTMPGAVPPAPTLLAPHARKPRSLPPTGGASAWDGPAPTFTETAGQEPVVPVSVGGVPSSPVATKAVTVALADAREPHGPDAAGLRQYRLALAGEARRYRNYPEAARRAGMAGTAEVRVAVSAGIARQTELARSSGHEMLDSAALEMLRAAAARTLLPESLRGQEFAVLLPVVFSVEE